MTKLYWNLELSEIIEDEIVFEIDEQFDPELDKREFIECVSCEATFEFRKDNNFAIMEIK